MNQLQKELEALKNYTYGLEVQIANKQNQRLSLLRQLQYRNQRNKPIHPNQCLSCESYRRQLQLQYDRQLEIKGQNNITGDQSIVQSYHKETLQKSLSGLRHQNMMLQQIVQQQQQMINKLTQQLHKRDRSSSSNYCKSGNHSLLLSEVQRYKIQLDEMTNQLNSANARYQELFRKMQSKSPLEKKINEQILKMEQKIEELENNKNSIEDQTIKLQEQLYAKDHQIINLRRELASRISITKKNLNIKSSRDSTEPDCERLYEQNRNLKSQLQSHQHQVVEKNENMTKYVEQIYYLKRQINNRDVKISVQQEEIQRLHSYIETYEDKIDAIERQLEQKMSYQIKVSKEREQFQINKLKRQINLLKNEIQRLTKVNEALSTKLQIQKLSNLQPNKKHQYQTIHNRSQTYQHQKLHSYQAPPKSQFEQQQLKSLIIQLKKQIISTKQQSKKQNWQSHPLSNSNTRVSKYISSPKLKNAEKDQIFCRAIPYICSERNSNSKYDRGMSSKGSCGSNQNIGNWLKMQNKIQSLKQQNSDLKSVLISRRRLKTRC